MPMDEQIIVLYAGTQGFLDDLPVESIGNFEQGLLSYFRSQKPEIKEAIVTKKALDEELKNKINEAISAFKSTFQP
ncbi:ATP synthase subunit alpha [bacterium BMS3Bbin07]|nr:ATP synthase subunit alpha [bacterium BMS3Bbin07]